MVFQNPSYHNCEVEVTLYERVFQSELLPASIAVSLVMCVEQESRWATNNDDVDYNEADGLGGAKYYYLRQTFQVRVGSKVVKITDCYNTAVQHYFATSVSFEAI